MKRTFAQFLLLIMTCLVQSCSWCRGVDCDVYPGVELQVEFLNSNNENMIQQGELTEGDILYIMGSSTDPKPAGIYDNKAVISAMYGEEQYTLFAGDHELQLVVKIVEEDDDCCSSYRISTISVDGVNTTLKNNGITIRL